MNRSGAGGVLGVVMAMITTMFCSPAAQADAALTPGAHVTASVGVAAADSRLPGTVHALKSSGTSEAEAGASASARWAGKPVPSTKASSQPCASLLFVGVRGSGEKAPYGTTVSKARDALAARWKGHGSVREVWLDYPATDPHTLADESFTNLLLDDEFPSTKYFDSATEGADKLSDLLDSEGRRCPKEWTVLAGYSQGAQAITEALGRTSVPNRLAGALLMGNPDRYPTQHVQSLDGTADLSGIGMAALLHYLRGQARQAGSDPQERVQSLVQTTIDLHSGNIDTAALRKDLDEAQPQITSEAYPQTYSVCLKDDIVCDSSGYVEKIITMKQTWQDALSAGSQVHHGYNPDVMPESLDAIAARMNTIGTADSQGAPVPHADQEPPRAWGPWQILAIVGGVLVGILIGAVLGRGKVRAARRRGTTHGTPPRGTRHSVRPHETRPYKDQRRRRRRAK